MSRWPGFAFPSVFFSVLLLCLGGTASTAVAQGESLQVTTVVVGADSRVAAAGDAAPSPVESQIIAVREPSSRAWPRAEATADRYVAPVAVVVVQQPPPVEEPERYGLPYEEPASPRYEPQGSLHLGLFVEELRLGSFGLSFEDPEVSAISGGTIPLAEPWASPLAGGFRFGGGYRPLPWLRIPEFSVSIGGGSADGAWVPVGDDNAAFEARLTSIFLLRGEVAGGVELPLGPLRPFALGRVGVAGYWVGADVRHGEIGDLGTEDLSRAAFEAGFDVGLAVRVAEGSQISATWRETFGDSRWRGLSFSYTAIFDD